METIEYRTDEKSGWGDGPWQQEPDKKQWQDEATGYPCLIVRNRMGALCGYVGVPKTHPSFEKDYDHVDVEVHGGLTFADHCHAGVDESRGICHKADGDDHVWWLGFDCAHSGDLCPEQAAREKERGWGSLRDGYETYKAFGYVTRQVQKLAAQLKAMEPSAQAA